MAEASDRSHSRDRTPPWPLRSELELVSDQVRGIDAWSRAEQLRERTAESVSVTREMRLDASRRLMARKSEQAAVLARAAEQLERSARLLDRSSRPRALVVHRNAWLRQRVAEELHDQGLDVLEQLEDGAAAVGALVVDQPDVLLVEDRLPTLTGLQVLEQARRYAPRTVVGVQLLDGSDVDRYLDAGARAVFTRRIPPREVADRLVSCLAGSDAAVGG
jgi:CheY-like chemotaxis protein